MSNDVYDHNPITCECADCVKFREPLTRVLAPKKPSDVLDELVIDAHVTGSTHYGAKKLEDLLFPHQKEFVRSVFIPRHEDLEGTIISSDLPEEARKALDLLRERGIKVRFVTDKDNLEGLKPGELLAISPNPYNVFSRHILWDSMSARTDKQAEHITSDIEGTIYNLLNKHRQDKGFSMSGRFWDEYPYQKEAYKPEVLDFKPFGPGLRKRWKLRLPLPVTF